MFSKCSYFLLVFFVIILLKTLQPSISVASIYQNPNSQVEDRVNDLIAKMTLEEKIDLLSGDETGFATKKNLRLGIPSMKMTDGPVGVRYNLSTAFPSGISMAATFNPGLVSKASKAMALETLAKGRDVLLAPCVNISRHPFGGRNFESFGEDPYLTSEITRGYLRGLQGQKVIPSTKHFGLNEQEHKRMTINVVADERTMHEIHFPAFIAAVEEGTLTIMASYNRLNGKYASENDYLLNKTLKGDWGFKGLVVSDWEATHSTVNAANAGLDLEMPFGVYFGKLLPAIHSGLVSEETINDKVKRILRVMFKSGVFDRTEADRPSLSVVGSPEHLNIAKRLANESIVLLKNDKSKNGKNILPIDLESIRSIAVIGPGANNGRTGGGGSSRVDPTRIITPLDGLNLALGQSVRIQYAPGVRMKDEFEAIPSSMWFTDEKLQNHGLKAEYFNNMELSGEPVIVKTEPLLNFYWGGSSPDLLINKDHFSARWTGYLQAQRSGEYELTARTDDGIRVFVDGKIVINSWIQQGPTDYQYKLNMTAGNVYSIKVEYFEKGGDAVASLGLIQTNFNGIADATKLAAKSDMVLLFAGMSANYESEGFDRPSMDLPEKQNELIEAVVKANPNTVLIVNGGNPVSMPWIDRIKGLVYAWYAGQEGGYAITDVLTGVVNPSGKLPVSFPKKWEDAAAYGAYPEDSSGVLDQVTYREGIYVGYRHFDTKNIDPLFPFGYGLSYTLFTYENLFVNVIHNSTEAPEIMVSFEITNTGSMAGMETAQLYVSPVNPSIDRPVQELKGFKKVNLASGETQRVTLKLDKKSFAYFDPRIHNWHIDQGVYEIWVGSSSRSIHLNSTINLK